MPVNERLLEQATVDAILEAPAKELRTKTPWRDPQFAPAFFARVRRIYKELAAKAAAR